MFGAVPIVEDTLAENIQFYTAQNDLIVLDKNDMLQLAQELEE